MLAGDSSFGEDNIEMIEIIMLSTCEQNNQTHEFLWKQVEIRNAENSVSLAHRLNRRPPLRSSFIPMGVITRAVQYGDAHSTSLYTAGKIFSTGQWPVLTSQHHERNRFDSPLGCHISDVNLQVGGEFG